jgi:hypothetical protein
MSIEEILEKIKPFYSLLLILIISVVFFELGRISILEEKRTPLKISYPNATSSSNALFAENNTNVGSNLTANDSSYVIGSKTGKKYYFPWCSTVKRIKPENQVKFISIETAKASGYTPGGNCKGLN